MTVSTFRPDGSVESTSVDGMVNMSEPGSTWTNNRNSAGDSATDSAIDFGANLQQDSADPSTFWAAWSRGIMLFDTSSLPNGDAVTAATIALTANFRDDDLNLNVSIVASNPASNTALVAGDFDSFPGLTGAMTKQAADVDIGGMTVDSETATTFTLNATGRGNISTTGVSKFGIVIANDADDSEPGMGSSSDRSYIKFFSADEAEAGDERPLLTVTHVSTFTPKAMMF